MIFVLSSVIVVSSNSTIIVERICIREILLGLDVTRRLIHGLLFESVPPHMEAIGLHGPRIPQRVLRMEIPTREGQLSLDSYEH